MLLRSHIWPDATSLKSQLTLKLLIEVWTNSVFKKKAPNVVLLIRLTHFKWIIRLNLVEFKKTGPSDPSCIPSIAWTTQYLSYEAQPSWDFKKKSYCCNLINENDPIPPPRHVITHIVQVEGDEAVEELCCVSGALRGADYCAVPYAN